MAHSGRVLRAQGRRFLVWDAHGHTVPCHARRRLRRPDPSWPVFPVPGDEVEWEPEGATDDPPASGVIVAVRPRRSEIARTRQGRKHVVVANLDLLVVVVAVRQPNLDRGLLDRLLATAERNAIPALICLHKVDLAEPGEFDAVQAIYDRIGYRVLLTSAETGQGLDALKDALRGHTAAFMGPSGAGKSRLIGRLEPGLELRTGMVNPRTGQGRHTTTSVELHPVSFGALLADTPGVRAFSLWRLDPAALRDLFVEFRPLQDQCRFSGCTHDHEPGCAVKAAVDDGAIDPGRYGSYRALLHELRDAEAEARRSGRHYEVDQED